MRYQLAIFDVDGTLADSFAFFVAVQNRLALRHGFRRIDPEEVESLRGRSAREMMRHVGLPRWKLPWVARSFVALVRAEGQGIALFEGVDEALRALHQRGVALAVVTSNARDNARRVLGEANWERLVRAECGASMFGKRRRIARVLKAAGVPAQRAIYVGDQVTDAEAARAAGVAFGAVSWGYAARDALLSTRPDVLFERVAELAALGDVGMRADARD
ncbi:MAG TPA: HAD hydrolase-like protein [Xanthomonadales bacterium]|nr:HAD hydrolase-like protein [Xanthomonadales bacterium]